MIISQVHMTVNSFLVTFLKKYYAAATPEQAVALCQSIAFAAISCSFRCVGVLGHGDRRGKDSRIQASAQL